MPSLRLPMPYDREAGPYLFCRRCKKSLPFGPHFGSHPLCSCSPCPLETRYKHPLVKCFEQTDLSPIIAPPQLRKRLKLPHFFLKNETVLPTYSWKDRVNEVHARLAKQWKFKRVQTISTGNHGISLAAQCRRQGLDCHIFVHPHCPEPTRQLMRYFGATLTPYGRHPHDQLRRVCKREQSYPAVSLEPMDGIANPFGAEGYKQIAEEIIRQCPMRKQTWVVIPSGIGDGVFGVWKGFCELKRAGKIRTLPRLAVVQGSGCAPLVEAFEKGWPSARHLSRVSGIALSIREPYSGQHALQAVRDSRGTAVAVNDREILRAMAWLADEGLLIEPASAATVAAAARLARSRKIPKADQVVCILSGSGVKWTGASWLRKPPQA